MGCGIWVRGVVQPNVVPAACDVPRFLQNCTYAQHLTRCCALVVHLQVLDLAVDNAEEDDEDSESEDEDGDDEGALHCIVCLPICIFPSYINH